MRSVRDRFFFLLRAGFLLAACATLGLSQDARIDDNIFAAGLDRPSDLEFSADGRLFFVEQAGLIKVFPTLTSPTPVVVADLRSSVGVSIDAGMHGLAVHPQFPTQPYLYVSHAIAGGLDPAGRLVRITVDPATNLEIPGARLTLMEGWCRRTTSDGIRTLDDLAFGPDGALYLSAGDWGDTGDYTGSGACPDPIGAGGAFRSQDRATPGDPFDFNGSIIRVDPATGAPMAGNPLEASSDADLRYMIADGLRSPFRITIQPGTESLWIGDVGEGSFEEINKIEDINDAVIENFGHPCFEGPNPHAPGQASNPTLCAGITPTPPVKSYAHGQPAFAGDACTPGVGGSSISALGFYPGGDYPAEYFGALFLGDYSRNCIWAMLPDAFGDPDPNNMVTVVDAAVGPADIAAGPDGDIFYSDVAGGTIRRLEANSNEPPPPPDNPVNVALGKPVQQSSSWDNLGPEKAVDGSLAGTEQQVSHTDNDFQAWWQIDLEEVVEIDEIVLWNRTDCCQDRLTNFHVLVSDTPFSSFDLQGTINQPGVTDFAFPGSAGRETRIAVQRSGRYVRVQLAGTNFLQLAEVEVFHDPNGGAQPPVPVIDSPTPSFTWVTGSTIAFSGSATTATGASIPAAFLDWAVLLNHCIGSTSTCHQHQVQAFPGTASASVLGPDHGYPASVEIRLTATDPDTGAEASTAVTIQPQTVILTFDTSPTGLELLAGENPDLQTTPFTGEFIIGSTATMIAPIEQSLGGTDFTWESWSDGGNRVHSPAAPSAPTTFTAIYAPTNPVNSPPVPTNPGAQTHVEGDAVSLFIIATDDDEDILTFGASGLPTGLGINALTGEISGSVAAGSAGPYSATVSVSDGLETVDVLFSWTITAPPNQDPTADPQSLNTPFETPLPIVLTGSDPDLDPLTFAIVTPPASGLLSGTAPNVTYTPNAAFSGPDSFAFSVDDGRGGVAQAVISITVGEPANQDPTADPQSLNTPFETPLPIVLTGSDPDLDPLTFATVTPPASGVLSGTAPNVTYTPNAAFSGPDSFTFSVDDGRGGVAQAIISITVGDAPNQDPTADPQSLNTPFETPLPIVLTGSDPDLDLLTFAIVTPPTGGVLSGTAPNVTYTPNAAFSGPDSFTFSVDDGRGGVAQAIISITVGEAANQDPTADPQLLNTAFETPLPIVLTGSDPDLDPLTFAIVTPPTSGVLSGTAPNVTYTPNAAFSGPDSFTFSVDDGRGGAAQAIISITVGEPANQDPTADPQLLNTGFETPLPIVLTGSDPDLDPLTFAIVTPPTSGVLSGTAPNVTYTPNAAFSGPDSFTFSVDDGRGGVAQAIISITVGEPANQDPTADPQLLNTGFETPLPIVLTGSDPDLDPLTFAIVTPPTSGVLSGTTPNVTYTPNAAFSGPDSFTFSVDDGRGGVAQAVISITVGDAPNQDPTADPQLLNTPFETPLPIVLTGSDPDLDPLTFAIVTPPASGALSGAAPNVTYTPNAAFSGPDSFTFSVDDGRGGVAQAIISITVGEPANQDPTADPQLLNTAFESPLPIVLTGSDPDLDPLTFAIVAPPTNGVLSGAAPNVTYTPNAAFSGPDSFTFSVDDGRGGAAQAVISITVGTPPTIAPLRAEGINVAAATEQWQTIALAKVYVAPVVVCTPEYGAGSPPLVARLRNVGSTAFEMQLARFDGLSSAVLPTPARCFAVEEGVYNIASHGVKLEAFRFTSTVTDRAGSWTGEARTYSNTYSSPVVVGQVMSSIDANPSAFWARGANVNSPPTTTKLFVGKNIAEDSNTVRADETIGYIVVEAGLNTIDGLTVETGLKTGVKGYGNAPPYAAVLTTNPSGAVLSGATMAGGNGGWPILFGPGAVGPQLLNMAFDEDQIGDTERVHINERVAYLAWTDASASNQPPTANPQTLNTAFATALPIVLTGSDPDIDPLTFAIVTPPASGALSGAAPNLIYTPGPAFSGPDFFVFSVDDGRGGLSQATVSINVAPPPNQLPTADPQLLNTAFETALPIVLTGSDPDFDPLTFSIVSPPSSGALSGVAPNVTYTPNASFSGPDAFTFSVNDGRGGIAQAVVSITVGAQQSALMAEVVSVNGISSEQWLPVALAKTYVSPVIVCSPIYSPTDPGAVIRMRAATSTGFEVRATSLSSAAPPIASMQAQCLAVEEGVYTSAANGVKLEAVRYLSTVTDSSGSWSAQARSYANAYASPVVVGQVMTANDAEWSSFWSRGLYRSTAPNSNVISTGKHVGEDPNKVRAPETIGYIVMESGAGVLGGLSFEAGVGGASIRGRGNTPPYSYTHSLTGANAAVVSSAGMVGNDGGWPVLLAPTPLPSGSIQLMIDEDQRGDSETSHIAERVAYVLFALP